jgi:hypothetical protein
MSGFGEFRSRTGIALTSGFGAKRTKILEPYRRQFGVAYGVLDILMAEIGLQRPGVVPLVGERVAAGVPEHMGVSIEAELGLHQSRSDLLGLTKKAEVVRIFFALIYD